MKGFGNSSDAAVYPGDQSFHSLDTVSPAYIYYYTATMWLRNGSVRVEACVLSSFWWDDVCAFIQSNCTVQLRHKEIHNVLQRDRRSDLKQIIEI